MEHARVGLTRTVIRGFSLQRPDIGYRVESLEADLSVWDIYFRSHVRIGDIRATGVEFDFTRIVREPRPEDRDPLEGLLGELDVPVMLTIGDGSVAGRLLFPGAGEEPLVAAFRLIGGDLSPGGEGRFELETQIEDPAADRWLREMEGGGQIHLRQDAEGNFDRLEASGRLQALGPNVPYAEVLFAEVLMERVAGGETYSGVLAREVEDERFRLLEVKASFDRSERLFGGNRAARLEREQVAGFLEVERIEELPEFEGVGDGGFEYVSESRVFVVSGRLDAKTGDLGAVAEELGGFGGYGLFVEFDFQREDDWRRWEGLFLQIVSSASGEVLMEAANRSPIHYRADGGRVESGEGEAASLEVMLSGAPMEWTGLFHEPAEGQREWRLNGYLDGRFLLSVERDHFVVETIETLRTDSLAVTVDGERWVSGAGLKWNGKSSWSAAGFGVHLAPLVMIVDGREALEAEGELSRESGRIDIRVAADLPLLLRQSGMDLRNLVTGRFQGELTGTVDGELLGGAIFLGGRMRGAEKDLPPVYVDLRIQQRNDGTWRFEAPVRVDSENREFELVVSGEAGLPGEGGRNRFDLDVRGEHLFMDDLLELKEAFIPPERRGATVEVSDSAFWEDWDGRLRVVLKSIQFSDGYAIETVDALVRTSEDGLQGSVEALVLGGQVVAEATLGFDPEAEYRYRLRGEARANQVDLGTLLHVLQPGRPSTIEGYFSISTDFMSEAASPGELAGRIHGELGVRSDSGVLRLFYSDNPWVGLGLGLGGLIGTLGGESGTIGEIAEALEYIPYDRIEGLVRRDRELNFFLSRLTILSPEFYLEGLGNLRHRADLDFADRPMNLEIQMGARGNLEEMLGRAGALGDVRNSRGYREFQRSFSVDGTPADLDVNPLFTVILRAIVELAMPLPGRGGSVEEGEGRN